MKLKNLGYIKLLSVIMTLLMLVSFVPAAAVNDDGGLNSQTSETGTDSYESSAKADNTAELETESVSIEFEVEEDKGSSGLGTAGEENEQTRLPAALADGVYMLENLYHTGYYMSVRGASLDAGARIVPRQYSSGTPISTFDRQSLFKISKVPGTTRYVIRSMLNNGIGLGIVNGNVVTKELPFDDADVSANDTFTITGLPTSGYQINPYVGGGILAAELGTMSDDPSVGAYVVQGNASTVGNRGKWTLTAYSGVEKYGFDCFRTAGMGDGLVKGYTYYMWPKSWSTVIGANTPCVTVDSTYTDDIVTFAWNEDELCATFTGEKCDDFQINMEIRVGNAQTATNTITRGYTVIPDVIGKTVFIENVATGKFVEVTDGCSDDGTIIQQNQFNSYPYMQWIFEPYGDGFFKIKSNDSGKYIGIDSSITINSRIKLYSTVTDYTLWKIQDTTQGNYKIICKSDELERNALSTINATSGNGGNLTAYEYSDEGVPKDKWNLYFVKYTSTVNNYYDLGYCVRYSETDSEAVSSIRNYNSAVAQFYMKTFGLLMNFTDAQYYNSPIDQCKGEVTSSNIDDLCTHGGTKHTDRSNVISSFKTYCAGSNVISNILWTSHKIKSITYDNSGNPKDEYNRSCSSGYYVYMLTILNGFQMVRDMQSVLFHELNHQYGVDDHYHGYNAQGTCISGANCSECGSSPRPMSCVMYHGVDINSPDILCDECMQEIIEHLENHH